MNHLLAVQYLESLPDGISPADSVTRLRQACERLPISLVLLGWDLPPAFEEAIAKETTRQHARLFHWQPLLTGEAQTDLPAEWQTTGLDGKPVAGHADMPEFTFVCPNNSGVADFVGERLESVLARGVYEGIFLDRIRFPSPAADPSRNLACFCKDCRRLAADAGLDLETVRRSIQSLLTESNGAQRLICSLFGQADPSDAWLERFLDFRLRSVTRLVGSVAKQSRLAGLEVGLDCFSPSLTRMVGQDLTALNETCDWIKIMTYPRVFGPAGIPFELLGLLDWLIKYDLSENRAVSFLREASGLLLPATKAELWQAGLGSGMIAGEIQRGAEMKVTNLLAGIALVEMKTIHESTPEQMRSDLLACAQAQGLVLSWDLWHMPPETLEIVRDYLEAS